jgi:hypothetical protein
MERISKDRIALINAMNKVAKSGDFPSRYNSLVDAISSDSMGDYLSLAGNGERISYARKPTDIFVEKRRVVTTLQKYLANINQSKLLIHDYNCDVNHYDINTFAEKVHQKLYACNSLVPTIKVLRGQDIVDHYKTTNNKSCMTGSSSIYTNFYAINPEKVGLLLFDNLRALIWTTDEGKTVLDRIYPSNHWRIEPLLKWSKSQGYVTTRYNDKGYDYDYDDYEENNRHLTDRRRYNVTMKLFRGKDQKLIFPHLDTFCFEEIDNKIIKPKRRNIKKITLTNKIPKRKGRIVYGSTDGSFQTVYICLKCKCACDDDGEYIECRESCKGPVCDNCISLIKCKCKKCTKIINYDY